MSGPQLLPKSTGRLLPEVGIEPENSGPQPKMPMLESHTVALDADGCCRPCACGVGWGSSGRYALTRGDHVTWTVDLLMDPQCVLYSRFSVLLFRNSFKLPKIWIDVYQTICFLNYAW